MILSTEKNEEIHIIITVIVSKENNELIQFIPLPLPHYMHVEIQQHLNTEHTTQNLYANKSLTGKNALEKTNLRDIMCIPNYTHIYNTKQYRSGCLKINLQNNSCKFYIM